MKFVDYLTETAKRNKSALCAGFDPMLDQLPEHFLRIGAKKPNNDEMIYTALFEFYRFAIQTLESIVACIKPNIAFFEQYGPAGMRALADLLIVAREHSLPSIIDCKRGDIGSTAQAYANAYFGRSGEQAPFNTDAITVNPFLGFDTVEVFLRAAIEKERGIFILVKTSNPGSADFQDRKAELSISERIAAWIEIHWQKLAGTSYPSLSGVGAVVGATHPTHLKTLRAQMPHALFLVPGYGAQGGKAEDLVHAFTEPHTGAVINASRALMNFNTIDSSLEELKKALVHNALSLSKPLVFL